MCLVEGYEPLPVLTCFMFITVIFRLFVSYRRCINIVFVCPVYPPYSVVLLSIGLTASISSVESAGFATALQGFVIISCLSFVRRPPPAAVLLFLHFLSYCRDEPCCRAYLSHVHPVLTLI